MAISPGIKLAQPTKRYYPHPNGRDDDGYLMSDGKPMAETDQHQDAMFYAINTLKYYFRDRDDVYVSGNNFVHFVMGDRNKYLSPDCYVVFGVKSKKRRDNFKTWLEGASPGVVFEFTSKDTRNEDTGKKRTIYEQFLKTSEYYLFDPKGEYLTPRLQGLILENGRYRDRVLSENERFYSDALGLEMGYEGEEFRFYDPRTGEALRTPLENALARDVAEFQLQIEREAAREALRIERETAERQLRIERERAEAERQQADAEIARLRAELDALKQKE